MAAERETEGSRNRARFAAFSRAVTNSAPSRAARSQGDLSMKYPEHYLKVSQPSKPPPKPPPAVWGPLEVIRRLQKPSGRWDISPELVTALGGYIPDPPSGISAARWLASLVVAFIRRQPTDFDAMQPVLEACADYTSDKGVMAAAAAALPPVRGYAIEETAVQARRWREETLRMITDEGYTAFLRPKSPPDARAVALRYAGLMSSAGAASVPTTGPAAGTPAMSVHPSQSRSALGTPAVELRASAPADDAITHVGSGTAVRRSSAGTASTDEAHAATLSPEELAAKERAQYRENVATWRQELSRVFEAERRAADREKVRARRQLQRRGLETEWAAATVVREIPMQVGERVDVFWRREHSWCTPQLVYEPQPAQITRINMDGTVDVVFMDGSKARESRVERRHVRRHGERGFVVGRGGNGLPYGRARALADRWRQVRELEDEVAECQRIIATANEKRAWDTRFTATEAAAGRRASASGRVPRKLPAVRQPPYAFGATTDTRVYSVEKKLEFTGSSELVATATTDQSTKGKVGGHSAPRAANTVSAVLREEAPTSPSNEPIGAHVNDGVESDDGSRRDSAERRGAGEGAVVDGGSEGDGEPTGRTPRSEVSADGVGEADRGIILSGEAALSRADTVAQLSKYVSAAEAEMAALEAQLGTAATEEVGGEVGTAYTGGPSTEASSSNVVVFETLKYEALLRELYYTVQQNAEAYATCDTLKEQNEAFDGTTALIRKLRDQCVVVVNAVSKWHLSVRDDTRPFLWNGSNLLVQVIPSLDFLGSVPELVEWYGVTYMFARNPLGLPVAIDDRPNTPRAATRRVLIAGQEVQEEVESLVEGRKADLALLQEWQARVQECAPWWPSAGLSEDQVLACWKTARVLLVAEGKRPPRIHPRA